MVLRVISEIVRRGEHALAVDEMLSRLRARKRLKLLREWAPYVYTIVAVAFYMWVLVRVLP